MLQDVGLPTGIHLWFTLEGAALILFIYFACSAEIPKQFVFGAVDGTRWTDSVVRSFLLFKLLSF